jgi:outer membrane protein assembly factor BamB
MRRLATLLALTLPLCSLFTVRADNWPAFRGPTADGHSSARNLPTTWNEKSNVVWKTPIHDKGWSSPVVWGKQVWLTTATETGSQFFAVCIDLDSGQIIHDIKVHEPSKRWWNLSHYHPFNSCASPTPVLEEGRVYVHFGFPCTACIDTTSGKVLWRRTDLKCDHFRGAGSSPILYGDLLILTFDGFDLNYVVALNKNTGETVWKTDRNIKYTSDNGDLHKAYATPAVFDVGGKTLLVCPSADATIAYDPKNGNEIWRVYHGGMNGAARPLYGHGKLFLTSGHDKKLLAVRPDGSGDVTKTHVDWLFSKGVPTRPSLLLIGDLLYMICDDGQMNCVEAKTGQLVKTVRLNAKFSSSPVFADGKIYAQSEDHATYVIEASPELKLLSVNKFEEGEAAFKDKRSMASPAVTGRSILIRTSTHLYRIETK